MKKYSLSCFITAFFFFIVLSSDVHSTEKITLNDISDVTKWRLLLHVDSKDRPQITDPKFLLSHGSFSLERELQKTIDLLQLLPTQAYCQFPARISFLNEQLQLGLDMSVLKKCNDLAEFRRFVPFENLTLVFASEVVSSASSMMGHIFFKAEGTNFKGNPVAHSLAYFTEINTVNPFKLLYESTVSGMSGFFSVRPFDKDVVKYLANEQRNLWQYSLNASTSDLNLLQLHLWELKGLDIKYLFQSYNCATMTLELLALLNSDAMNYLSQVVTPVDVVKAALNVGMVKKTDVEVSDLWLYHLIDEALTDEQHGVIKSILSTGDERSLQSIDPMSLEYLDISFSKIDHELSEEKKLNIREKLKYKNEFYFNLQDKKRPDLTPQDAGFMFDYTDFGSLSESHQSIKLGYLTAGHFLTGDNRQYLAESELLLGYAALEYNTLDKNISVDELTIYHVKSLAKKVGLFPSLSNSIYIGYHPVWQSTEQEKSVFEMSGSLGQTYKPHKDINIYWLAGGGGTATLSQSSLFAKLNMGFIVDSLANTKLVFDYQYDTGRVSGVRETHNAVLSMSWFASDEVVFTINAEKVKVAGDINTHFGLEVARYF